MFTSGRRAVKFYSWKWIMLFFTTMHAPLYTHQQQTTDDFPWSDYSILNQQPATFEDLIKQNASCDDFVHFLHTLNYNFRMNASTKSVAFPMFNYAYYSGQGFGRLVQHSTLTCILAMSLNRPCVIDIDPRDEYYVWRSFINIGSYNWNKKAISPKTQTNIDDAISKLPPQDSGAWEKELFYDDIVPLYVDNTTNKSEMAKRVNYWNGNNAKTRNKVLVSPNWGGSWFTHYAPYQPWKDASSQCSEKELSTLVQNSLYMPTIVSKKLHQRDRDLLFNETIYGSIHLRQEIINSEAERLSEPIPTEKDLSDALKKCLNDEEFVKMGVEKWWIIGDNVDLVKNISKRFDDVYHLYSDEFIANDAHSMSDDARSMYGHVHMEKPVRDWMVLHESKVALVTAGAFGETGARGNEKVFRQTCEYYNVYY